MMKIELEERLGFQITDEGFEELNNMYMASTLDKNEFAKMVKSGAKKYQIKKEEKLYKVKVGITPNGCYYIVRYARLIDIDIKTGYNLIKYISNEERIEKGLDIYSYDFDLVDYKCKEVRA